MGEIEVKGPQALGLVQHVTPNDASRLTDGQAQYSALTTPQGTFVDDILVHRFGPEHFFLCVNAANTDKDAEWLSRASSDFDAQVANTSSSYTQLAIQGPRALEILQPLTPVDLGAIKYYWFTQGTVDGVPSIIARTGYTGEDGFELYFDPGASVRIWEKILESGRSHELRPCGLAARNTLRLEARMALYGHDIDETTTAYEADLGWIVKLNKGAFIGRERLADQKTEGIRRKLVGFEMVERGIARDGYIVFANGEPKGHVTSGSPAPYLKKNIGLTYLPIRHTEPGTRLEIDIRGKMVAAEVVPTPFYKRAK
jgi:aminomethyltransferase